MIFNHNGQNRDTKTNIKSVVDVEDHHASKRAQPNNLFDHNLISIINIVYTISFNICSYGFGFALFEELKKLVHLETLMAECGDNNCRKATLYMKNFFQ